MAWPSTPSRPLNQCETCGYTWYPRGKNISLKCPKCGSTSVIVPQSDQKGCLIATLVFSAITVALILLSLIAQIIVRDDNRDNKIQQKIVIQKKELMEEVLPTISGKEIETFGKEYLGKKSQMVGMFLEFKTDKAEQIVQVLIKEQEDDLFLYCFGEKKKFVGTLLALKRNDPVRFVGEVMDLGGRYGFQILEIKDLKGDARVVYDEMLQKEAEQRETDEKRKAQLVREIPKAQEEEEKAVNVKKAKDAQEKEKAEIAQKAKEKADRISDLKDQRAALERKFPVVGQNGKTIDQIESELETAIGKAQNSAAKEQIRTLLAAVRAKSQSLKGNGLSIATEAIFEVESKMTEVNQANINPTLPNGSRQNGRMVYQSVSAKNNAKSLLQKELDRLKKYKESLEQLDDDIEELSK